MTEQANKPHRALISETPGIAPEELVQAADFFSLIHDGTGGAEGCVSLEMSPLLGDAAAGSIKAATELFARAEHPNLFIDIPSTHAGISAIEESVFAGVLVIVSKRILP